MPKKVSRHEKASLLRDGVLASSDGLITTFAIIAGSAGASLDNKVIIIVGLANLFADSFSMASGNYLGEKSEIEFEHKGQKSNAFDPSLLRHIWAIFLPFIIIGSIPLIPYLLNLEFPFYTSSFMVAITLFSIGCIRSYFTGKGMFRSGLESLFIGGIAAVVAYLIGYYIDKYS